MSEILIKSYSHRTVERVKSHLRAALQGSSLETSFDSLYQICDELIKNAVKANYKFLLLWKETRKRLLAGKYVESAAEADDWLREVFFSGEDVLIEKQLQKLGEPKALMDEVRELLNYEGRLIEYKKLTHLRGDENRRAAADYLKKHRVRLQPLMALKRMARELEIFVHFKIEKNQEAVLITVANDSPILKEDLKRIEAVRSRFARFAKEDRVAEFFAESLDTSGGGHGLGYAIMDCTLLEMGLVPEKSLYLIGASRTMVLLSLPYTN